jgi:hypothetical protein
LQDLPGHEVCCTTVLRQLPLTLSHLQLHTATCSCTNRSEVTQKPTSPT